MTIRRLSFADRLLSTAQRSVDVLAGRLPTERPNPAGPPDTAEAESLNQAQRRLSGSLMRVNHVGEICAQALYEGQGLLAKSPEIRASVEHAAREERDHLAWTAQRLRELDSRPSVLNPLWYGMSLAMGAFAARLGDKASMSFMMETERQVEKHLESHLKRLPAIDTRSKAIVAQMKQDETEHAATAQRMGGTGVPFPVRLLMKGVSRVMTGTAHYL